MKPLDRHEQYLSHLEPGRGNLNRNVWKTKESQPDGKGSARCPECSSLLELAVWVKPNKSGFPAWSISLKSFVKAIQDRLAYHVKPE